MGTFKSERTFCTDYSLMSGIAESISTKFSQEKFEVESVELGSGGYDISVTKGNVFNAVLGMRSALKITVEPVSSGIHVCASVGIFGQQAIPSIISMFVAWPVLITQIWGMVQQSKLDDMAINVAEKYIKAHEIEPITRQNFKFCPYCGKKQPVFNSFCVECGRNI